METVRVQRRGGGRGDYTCRRAGALAAVVGSLLAAPAALRASPPESAPVSRRASAAWTVLLELPKEWAAFAPARARVRVEALAGHHVNLDYPAGFAPAPESAGDFPAGRVPLEAVRQEKWSSRCRSPRAVPRPGSRARCSSASAPLTSV